MQVVNTRLYSAIAVAIFLVLGIAIAFGPFAFAGSDMKRFCAGLTPGSSKEQLQKQAHAHGYHVSYDAAEAAGDAGLVDAGSIDGGSTNDAPESIAPPPTRVIAGDALVTDPQFFRPTCALFFNDAGLLKSTVFDDD
jgi:hypothetical protein